MSGARALYAVRLVAERVSMIARVDIFTVFAIELPYLVDVHVVGFQGLKGSS